MFIEADERIIEDRNVIKEVRAIVPDVAELYIDISLRLLGDPSYDLSLALKESNDVADL